MWSKLLSNNSVFSANTHVYSQAFQHAIRTPLTNIYSLSSTWETTDQKNSAQVIKSIYESSQYLSEIIDTWHQPQKTQVFDLTPVIFEAVRLAVQIKSEIRVIIDKPISQSRPKVKGNRLHLVESLICLLNNAQEASLNAGRRPFIVITLLMHDKNSIKLEIIDNGPGLKSGFINQLLSRANKKSSHHLGIGRKYSYQVIARLFKGKIFTHSTHLGTRISVCLPVHKKSNQKIDVS